jgi:hypothetical protein
VPPLRLVLTNVFHNWHLGGTLAAVLLLPLEVLDYDVARTMRVC